jgi:hypothetical protein
MCEFCNWTQVLENIADMCAQGGYEFADKTLTGIRDRIKLVGHATDKQKQAVMNIKKSKKPRPGGAKSNFRPVEHPYRPAHGQGISTGARTRRAQ